MKKITFSESSTNPQQVDNKRIICYVEGVAYYRREPLVFTPQDLDPFACTHVIYAFASIDPHTYKIEARDEEYDIVQGTYILSLHIFQSMMNLYLT